MPSPLRGRGQNLLMSFANLQIRERGHALVQLLLPPLRNQRFRLSLRGRVFLVHHRSENPLSLTLSLQGRGNYYLPLPQNRSEFHLSVGESISCAAPVGMPRPKTLAPPRERAEFVNELCKFTNSGAGACPCAIDIAPSPKSEISTLPPGESISCSAPVREPPLPNPLPPGARELLFTPAAESVGMPLRKSTPPNLPSLGEEILFYSNHTSPYPLLLFRRGKNKGVGVATPTSYNLFPL